VHDPEQYPISTGPVLLQLTPSSLIVLMVSTVLDLGAQGSIGTQSDSVVVGEVAVLLVDVEDVSVGGSVVGDVTVSGEVLVEVDVELVVVSLHG
jgi:hypothetical protein